jgi:signal peptidase I
MRKLPRLSFLGEMPALIVVALVVSILVKTFLVQFFYIPSGSMENTLRVNDRVAVNKLANFFGEIKRGEVVVFRDPASWLPEQEPTGPGILNKVKVGLEFVGVLPDPAKQYLIKRVIGVGGDHVVCCDKSGSLKVNGTSIKEPYVYKGDKPSDNTFDITVPKGSIWVMGDHRSASADSRFHTDDPHKGMVPLSNVTGRAVFIIWPIKHAAFLPAGEALSHLP